MSLFNQDQQSQLEFINSQDVSASEFHTTGAMDTFNIEEPAVKGSANTMIDLLNSSSHPKVAFFHMVFKFLALATYFFGTWFVSSFSSWFIPCVLFIAADFWVTKNVSGRLMVGLRWWSEIDENGNSIWRFENRGGNDTSEDSRFVPTGENVSTNDYRIFWYSMYLNGALWGFFFVWNFMRIKITNLIVILIALSLQWSNIVGYWKCHKDMESKIESNFNSFIASNAFSLVRNRLFGSRTSEATLP